MYEVDYKGTKLKYEHIPLISGSNYLVGTRYRTKIYAPNHQGFDYDLGEIDGKASDEEVIAAFEEKINSENLSYHSRPSSFLLRKQLNPIRGRSRTGLWRS